MAVAATNISWTDATWSPVRGCSRASTGCERCYAEVMAGRFSGPGQPYEGLVRKASQGWKWTGEVRLIEKDLEIPLHWRKPKRIFVNSMSDLFHESVPDAWIDTIYAVMLCADALDLGHTFQILTKRAQRLHDYFAGYPWPRVSEIAKQRWNWHFGAGNRWYPQHIWLGVSVENQTMATDRIPWLLKTPAVVRFISAEPLLGPLELTSVKWYGPGRIDALTGRFQDDAGHPDDSALEGLAWCIVGGESGPQAGGCDVAWLRSVKDQCAAAGVACWVKQYGSKPYDGDTGEFLRLKDRKGADPAEWDEDMRVQQFPPMDA